MKNKKMIIILASVVSVFIIGVVAVLLLTNASTTTVNDLRILDIETGFEIKEREVYLVENDSNYFDISLKTKSEGRTDYLVYSSNPSIASVKTTGTGYRINYLKAGKTRIIATTSQISDIQDSFILTVNEFVPTEFLINNDDVSKQSEVEIFSDNNEYRFDFSVLHGGIQQNINKSSLSVLENYDKNVFEYVYIDDANSQLVVCAKQSEESRTEIITVQARQKNQFDELKTVKNFVIKVKIKGNYVSDIQLMLSVTPNFESAKYIYGTGLLKEEEQRVPNIYLTEKINKLYAKVRVVYTNEEMFDVTETSSSLSESGNSITSRPEKSDYFEITLQNRSEVVTFNCSGVEGSLTLTFNYLEEGQAGYDYFSNNELYKKILGRNGEYYYQYIYWDLRFMRKDAVTDSQGRIVDFTNGVPTCGDTYEEELPPEEESDNENPVDGE